MRNHLSRSSVTRLCVACAVLLVARVAPAAVPLAEHVPSDTVAYLGWAGAAAERPAFAASNFNAFLSGSNLPDLAQRYVPMAWDKATADADPKMVAALRQALPILWQHPTALYVVPRPASGDDVPFAAGCACDAGSDADALRQAFTRLAKGDPHLRVGGAATVVSLDANLPASVPTGNAAGLRGAVERLSVSSSAVTAYVDVDALLNHIEQVVPADSPVKQIWPKMRDALGLTPLKSFAMAAGFSGKDWMTTAYIACPGPRTGLLAVMEPKTIDHALLARVPATATSVSVTDFDAGGMLDTIKAACGVIPQGADAYGKVAGVSTMMLGRNLRQQIVGPLGTQWVTYVPAAGGSAVVVNKPADATAADDGLVSATYGAVNLINSQVMPRMPGGGAGQLQANQQKLGEMTVTSATSDKTGFAFGVRNGLLYVGTQPADVAAAAALPDAAPTLTHPAAYATAVARLGAPIGSGFTYDDLLVTAPNAQATFTALAKLARNAVTMAGGNGALVPDVQLPPIERIRPNLSATVEVNWADAGGIHWKSTSPFPLAGVVYGDPGSVMAATGGAAIGTSILLPSLNRAREAANRAKCASNEHQIGLAILLYQQDHQQKYPSDLGTLVNEEQIGGGVFLCPAGSAKLPDNFNEMNPDEKAKWINDHTDYIYLGKGLINPDANHIVLYEKDADHGGAGLNLLFGDGHVEWEPMAKAKDLIKQQNP